MHFAARAWRKTLTVLIAGSTAFFVAACYGVPVGFGIVGHWTIRVRDSASSPIPGLQVSVIEYAGNSEVPDTIGQGETDSTGAFSDILESLHKSEKLAFMSSPCTGATIH